MTIFYYFKELDTPMYQWQRCHLIDELERKGHSFITYNPLEYRNIDEANERVIEEITKQKKVDLFLACDDQDVIYRETVERVKELGIPTCLICWDNLELPYKQKKIAPAFDIVWITSIETKYLFEKWGCKNIIFQTYAANPYVYKPTMDKAVIPSIGFVGSPYGSRTNIINELLQHNVPCNIYSNALFDKGYNSSVGGKIKVNVKDIIIKAGRYLRFPIGRKVLYSTFLNKFHTRKILFEDSPFFNAFRSVDHNTMCELYSSFMLSINMSELRDTYLLKNPIHKIHLRTFEIPMCGGLQFTSYNDEIASYFEEDKEIVLYRSKEEMIDKAKYYLNPANVDKVISMKVAARCKAENEHTWQKRFEVVFNCI